MKSFLLRKTLIHAFYQNSVSERIEDLHQEQNLQLKLHLHVRENIIKIIFLIILYLIYFNQYYVQVYKESILVKPKPFTSKEEFP